MLAGEGLQVRPSAGFVDNVNPTVPTNPLAAAITILEVTGPPAETATDEGVTDIVKSCTVKMINIE